jgi:hypothetical protein
MAWEWRCFFNVDPHKITHEKELEDIWKDQLCTLFFSKKSNHHEIKYVNDPQRIDRYANVQEADYGLKCRGCGDDDHDNKSNTCNIEIKVREKTITGGIEKYTKYALECTSMHNQQNPRTSIDFLSLILSPSNTHHNQSRHHDIPPKDVLDTISSILKTLEHQNSIVVSCTKTRVLATCRGGNTDDCTVELTKCIFARNHNDTSCWWSIAISSDNKSHAIDFAKNTTDIILNQYTTGTVFCQGYPEFLMCFIPKN